MKTSKFEVHFYQHHWGYTEEKDTWRQAVKFVNYLDTYGGYADQIVVDGILKFKRHLDDEDGSDYWNDSKGLVVDLEQIEYRG